MGRINVLDKHMAELIAAGEVVERPSSVIKELVENSIDSGADAITVEIQNGGITMMRVTDNGCGILKDDIRNAFLRHATSKVRIRDDLDAIGTLGFRGEALASISAVSRVELITKAKEDEEGSHYVIEGCDEVLFEEIGCPEGTTFIIRDLFYNVPARMKFLKKNVSEANAVAAVIDKIALSHSEVAFTFIRDGKQTLVTAGDGNLKNCIYSVLGRDFSRGIVPADYELNGVKISGYVTKPQAARSSRAMQNFFINGRFVKSRTAMAALEEACKGKVMVGKFPGCVLHIDIPLSSVDVNVHPAKIEVRFVNERPIFEAVYHGVQTALYEKDTVKQFSFDPDKPAAGLISKSVVQAPYTMSQHTTEQLKNKPIVRPSCAVKPEKRAVENYNMMLKDILDEDDFSTGKSDVKSEKPAEGILAERIKSASDKPDFSVGILSDSDCEFGRKREKPVTNSRVSEYVSIDIMVDDEAELIGGDKENKPYESNEQISDNEKSFEEADNISENSVQQKESENADTINPIIPIDDDKIKFIGEAFSTYIIVERNNELVLVDKHALHERIIYEKLKREKGKKYAQYLLEPITVTLSRQQCEALIPNKDLMLESGFDIEENTEGSVTVSSAPSFIDASEVGASVEEMADHIIENKHCIDSEYTDWLYHNIACRSAIKSGDKSSAQELFRLYKMMEESPDYRYCPHGRPTSIKITRYQIEKQFGRVT